MLVGLTGASLSIILSAFATEPWHLVVTLGLLYPLADRKHVSLDRSLPAVTHVLTSVL